MEPGHQLSSAQIEELAMEFAKRAIFKRIEEKGSADIVHGGHHQARFFFNTLDYFLSTLTMVNADRKQHEIAPP